MVTERKKRIKQQQQEQELGLVLLQHSSTEDAEVTISKFLNIQSIFLLYYINNSSRLPQKLW
jgi:hypothetical protein